MKTRAHFVQTYEDVQKRRLTPPQTTGCTFHHVYVHELGLRLEGTAPDALVWTLGREPFTGR